jgi:hypothetical protein
MTTGVKFILTFSSRDFDEELGLMYNRHDIAA